jgi:hypothetical protein
LGAARAAAQALLLARDIFGIRLEPSLSNELERERANRWLAIMAFRQITRPNEPTQIRLGTLRIHLTQFLLHRGLNFKIGELRRQIADAARH